MMTDSQKSFVKVKLWFSKLINQSATNQQQQIRQLQHDETLDEKQIALLKQMLQADKVTGLATDVHEISNALANHETETIEPQVGNYKIIEPLGKGGMGNVYLAERNDGEFNQKVAIKLPHLSFNPSMKQRFENERQILAQLSHENIARLLDGGTTANNQPFLVMEYIKGQTIDVYCKDKIPSLNQRIKLIQQVCSAVSFSHQQLVLHRDLKPENILVTDSGQVKLLDFGIAKLTDLDEESQARKTATQIMTRNYASPEQIQGKPVSTHSDLFSLAIIAYELITGFHPFKHKDQIEREQNLITGKVMRISQRHINKSLYPELTKIPNNKLQGDLENILFKALSVEPEKRYASVKEFADDLGHFLQSRPVIARKPSKVYFFSKWLQRHKAVTVLLFITLFTLSFATLYSINKAKYAAKQQLIAEQQKHVAIKENQKSLQISEFLVNIFEKARPLPGKDEISAKDLLDQAFSQLQENEELDKDNKYHLFNVIANSYFELNKISGLSSIIDETYTQCVKDLSKFETACQKLLMTHARLSHKEKNYDQALVSHQLAEKIARAQSPQNDELLSQILINQFPTLMNFKEEELAGKKAEDALALLEKANSSDSKIYSTRINLSYSYLTKKKFKEADYQIAKIKEIINRLNLQEKYRITSFYQLMSYQAAILNKAQESVTFKEKLIKITEKFYPKKKPREYVFRLKGLALMYFQAGKIEKSIQTYDQLIKYYQTKTAGVEKELHQANTRKIVTLLANNQTQQASEILKKSNIISKSKHISSRRVQCLQHYSKAYLTIIDKNKPLADKENAIEEYRTCQTKKSLTYYNTYWDILHILLAIDQQDIELGNQHIKQANKLWEKYPNDYLGIKYLVDRLDKQLKLL